MSTLNKQAELLTKIDKGRELVLMKVQEITYWGMPVFWKNPTLRVCKILQSFFANLVTNKNFKTVPG
ncbi:hypothetical protein [Bacillus sp. FSL K6-0067]|uniref:hypothetical protein n=1 Tax=Bacillus sp. FSL K6-0067 TaxID=2921412 RepID=UPI002AA5BA00